MTTGTPGGCGRTVGVGLVWILTSAVFSTYANALFIRTFHDPFAHTFVRFALSSALGLVWASVAAPKLVQALPGLCRQLLVPSVLLLAANLLNSMALQRVGHTITYVMKSMIPGFTVVICRMRGQHFEPCIYWSLLPVCLGVAIASATDMSFNVIGFLCALASSMSQTLLNIASKESLKNLGLSGMEAFFVMATLCTILSTPLLFVSYYTLPQGFLRTCVDAGADAETYTELFQAEWPWLKVMVLAAFAYHIEYSLNFLYLALCSPLAFSVTDIVRRLGTICIGSLVFGKTLTSLNIFGVVTSLFGVVTYGIVSRRVAAKKASQEVRAKDLESWPAQYAALKVNRIKVDGGSRTGTPSDDSSPESPTRSGGSGGGMEGSRQWSLGSREDWMACDDSSLGIAPQALCLEGLVARIGARARYRGGFSKGLESGFPLRRHVTDPANNTGSHRSRSLEGTGCHVWPAGAEAAAQKPDSPGLAHLDWMRMNSL
eukprot:TRINITY_DN112157_c0_g1_i1.p1 TRINITY_DN112157_c0_g1~~TRINITY_DN112157_c0_g1_i1.p1  ORF type:complete len:488 (+),score=80.39 TRINITY_DN112157_c0_g1_i1:84-1547(+)